MSADFPYLDESTRFRFPNPRSADRWGVVAAGGNLSPGMLLSAYEQGIFPWYNEPPVLWHSPNPRFWLRVEDFHVPTRLRRELRLQDWVLSFDQDFAGVIRGCKEAPRHGEGTWISSELETAYTTLHALGHAHSVEVWSKGRLIGGLYGVQVGAALAGESMFSLLSGAGKAALIALAGLARTYGAAFIDCQVHTPLLASFGAQEIERDQFLKELAYARRIAFPTAWRQFDAQALYRGELERRP